MRQSKTITVAIKDGCKRRVENTRHGWMLPPDNPLNQGYIGGYKAYQECVKRWTEAGWIVEREPNPGYRAPVLFKLF
jgi:hypothetical protein